MKPRTSEQEYNMVAYESDTWVPQTIFSPEPTTHIMAMNKMHKEHTEKKEWWTKSLKPFTRQTINTVATN